MLGISRSAPNQDELWSIAKRLYLSPELARSLYTVGDIVTPVRTFWSDPVFDEPDPYFSGQKKGRAYINLAPDAPTRTSSPYNTMAKLRVQTAVMTLAAYARESGQFRPDELHAKALELLRDAEHQVRVQIDRNVFMTETVRTPGVGSVGGGA